jgi:CspA family cold shock protein
MKTGVVKFFNDAKGFGFIKVDETGEELFVHSSSLKSPIRENDKVQFDIQQGKKGLNAINVSIVR